MYAELDKVNNCLAKPRPTGTQSSLHYLPPLLRQHLTQSSVICLSSLHSPGKIPIMSKVMQHHRKLTNVADGQQDSRVPVDSTATALRSSDWARDSKPSFDALPLDILELIAEALISRGHVKSLGQLNATSKNVYHKTLRILWRTVVWDLRDRTPAEADVYWKRLMVDSPGSGHIQQVSVSKYEIIVCVPPFLLRTA